MSTPTIVTEECMGKAGFRQLQCGGVCAKRLFFGFRCLTQAPRPSTVASAVLSGEMKATHGQCAEDSAHYS